MSESAGNFWFSISKQLAAGIFATWNVLFRQILGNAKLDLQGCMVWFNRALLVNANIAYTGQISTRKKHMVKLKGDLAAEHLAEAATPCATTASARPVRAPCPAQVASLAARRPARLHICCE